MVKIQVDTESLERERTSQKTCVTVFEMAIRRRTIILLILLCIQIPVLYTLYRSEDPRRWREKLTGFAKVPSDARESIGNASPKPFGERVPSCLNRTCKTNRTAEIANKSSTLPTDNRAAIDGGGEANHGEAANGWKVETSKGVDDSGEHTSSTKSTKTVAGERAEIATNAAFQSPVVQATENDTEEILPLCPEEPPNLKGALDVSFEREPATFDTIGADNPLCENGGHFKPPFCVARNKVAIIIPFRNRDFHLRYFLQFMLPTLQRQQLEFKVYVINQSGDGKFNRAKLMNVGFVEALKDHDFGCFVFHDVDLILENDKCLYTCPSNPRHLSVGVDKFKYHLPYAAIFGGVTELTREQFQKVNGYSNSFWGWGGEDDDMFSRVQHSKMRVDRYGVDIARYKMISHNREKGNEVNPERFKLIGKTTQTMNNDGLNSLNYKVISRELHSSYTNITVDVLGPS